jgi:hypothetical protein
LRDKLGALEYDELYQIAEYLRLVPSKDANNDAEGGRECSAHLDDAEFLREIIVFICERRPSQLQRLNTEPLYPNERVFWDEKVNFKRQNINVERYFVLVCSIRAL